MSEAPLKVGDRVRIHGLENDGDIYSTTVGIYIECPELDGMTGTIIDVNKDGYIVREDSGYEEDFIGACLTFLERPRRTFEEIIDDLRQFGWEVRYGIGERQSYGCVYYINRGGALSFKTEPSTTCCRDELCAEELAAIAAACTEIAANYAAEHGKEEA